MLCVELTLAKREVVFVLLASVFVQIFATVHTLTSNQFTFFFLHLCAPEKENKENVDLHVCAGLLLCFDS